MAESDVSAHHREFTCYVCGREFVTHVPEAEVMAEYHERFPEQDTEDLASVCDDCDQKVLDFLMGRGGR